jgi:hypothetical protein
MFRANVVCNSKVVVILDLNIINILRLMSTNDKNKSRTHIVYNVNR